MDWLIKIGQFALSLSLLIVLHELGHFVAARIFKTKVEKFFLFFDYKFALIKKKIGDTVYGIGWIPLGGYVKIAGMIDESMDKEQLAKAPQPYEYRAKPAWQRLIIITAGVIVNIILACVIYIGMLMVNGDRVLPTQNLTNGVWIANDSVANFTGLKNGDKIIAIAGEPVSNTPVLKLNEKLIYAGGSDIKVKRNGETVLLSQPNSLDQDILRANARLMIYPRIPFIVGDLVDSSGAAKAGLKPKDKIVGINGNPITYFDEFKKAIGVLNDTTVAVAILRDGEKIVKNVHISKEGKIGAYVAMLSIDDMQKLDLYNVEVEKYNFFTAIPAGLDKGFTKIKSFVRQLGLIFTAEGIKNVGGFKTMANLFPPEWSWQAFWSLTALLSIMLAIMNILPIPALDGGHMVFILFEMITGKVPPRKFLEGAQMVGFFFLIALILYANINDFV